MRVMTFLLCTRMSWSSFRDLLIHTCSGVGWSCRVDWGYDERVQTVERYSEGHGRTFSSRSGASTYESRYNCCMYALRAEFALTDVVIIEVFLLFKTRT